MASNRLQTFVCFAGIYNLLLAGGLILPLVTNLLGINITDYALALLTSAFLVFTAAAQIIGSRDLKTYGWLIYWEGILRWLAAAVVIPYGFFGHLGLMTGVLGIFDLIIGAVFIFGTTKILSKTHGQLISGN